MPLLFYALEDSSLPVHFPSLCFAKEDVVAEGTILYILNVLCYSEFLFLIVGLFILLLQVFVEFENASQRCSWVQVYDEGVKAVLLEDSIVWATRSNSTGSTGASATNTAWPALVSPQ